MVHPVIPASGFLNINIAGATLQHPVVSIAVYIYTVVHGIFLLPVFHIVAHPRHLSFVAVEGSNNSVFQYHDGMPSAAGIRRDARSGSKLRVVHLKARPDVLPWVIVVQLPTPHLYPVVLSVVYIHVFHASFHSGLLQPWREVLLKLFGLWVIHAVFQFLLHPYLPVDVLVKFVHIVAEQCRAVLYV